MPEKVVCQELLSGLRAPARHGVVHFVQCLSEGRQDQRNQPNLAHFSACVMNSHYRCARESRCINTSDSKKECCPLYRPLDNVLPHVWKTTDASDAPAAQDEGGDEVDVCVVSAMSIIVLILFTCTLVGTALFRTGASLEEGKTGA